MRDLTRDRPALQVADRVKPFFPATSMAQGRSI